MPDFRKLVRDCLRGSTLSPEREAEIVEEFADHLQDRFNTLISSGSAEREALSTITSDLKQRDLAHELQYTEQTWMEPVPLGTRSSAGFLHGLWQDLRYGFRTLRTNPAFTTVCVLSLALGIGANTAIFQLIDSVRMRTLPVKNPQQLAVIRPTELSPRWGDKTGRYAYLTNPMWEAIRAQQQAFSAMSAWGNYTFNLANGGEGRPAEGLWVSGEFFDVLGIQPLLGRVLHPSDDHAGCGAVGAVISYAFWHRHFGGDPSVTNKTLSLDGHVFPILGVTPASFYGVEVGQSFDLAVPICSEPVILGENSLYKSPIGWWLTAMGRLKPGWSLEKAAAQLDAISPSVMQQTLSPIYPPDVAKRYLAKKLSAYPGATGVSNIRRTYETPLWLLLVLAGSVLLIACANLANLMLARASVREREIAVRLALGAARDRLIRQLLTESAMLAVAGALLGAGLARVLSQFLVNYLSTDTDGSRLYVQLSDDWRVLGFTTAIAVLTCIIFGLAPALKATSSPSAKVMSLAGRTVTASRERIGLRRALVVLQVALSLVLLVSAVLFAGSLRKILTLDAGFQRDGLLVISADFSRLQLPKDQRIQFAQSLMERIRALPGVEAASEAFIVPLSGNSWGTNVIIDGKTVMQGELSMNGVSDGYFKTMGTPLLAGRDFNRHDTINAPPVAIVNQEFARKFLGTENPIGRTFRKVVFRGDPQPNYQIVGLVKDTKYHDLRENFPPLAYFPQTQDDKPSSDIDMIVRSNLDLQDLLPSLRHAIAEVNPAVTIDFQVFNQQVKEKLVRERLMATLSGFFGALAAVLATIGLYGVIAYSVVKRSSEIGIRIALGAAPSRILSMVVREAAILVGFGLFIGTIAALIAGKTAETLLYGLKPHDPMVLTAACAMLAAVALAASLLPALRAARVQPMTALRED